MPDEVGIEIEIVRVPVMEICDSPFQVRDQYDPATIKDLAENILAHGLQQYPVVRRVGEKYQLVFGHRRTAAYKYLYQIGHKDFGAILCRVENITDKMSFEWAISENLKRDDLNPIERARALKRYMSEFHANSVDVARLFGMAPSTVRGNVRLLALPQEKQNDLEHHRISQGEARRILRKVQRAKGLADGDSFDLRASLITLIFGKGRRHISDRMIFMAVKNIFERNKELDRRISEHIGQKGV